MRPSRFAETAKTFQAAKQRTLRSLLPATPPQFLYVRIQKYRRNARSLDQPRIVLLHKSTAAKGDYLLSPGTQLTEQFSQRRMFRPAKLRFARFSKYFRHGPPLAPFNTFVEILKSPTQPLAQSAANTGFARAHKADQEHGAGSGRTVNGPSRGATHSRLSSRALSRPFTPIRFSLRFLYLFSGRFLRWILPLKERSTTVDETATLPMVPAKARPLSTANQV